MDEDKLTKENDLKIEKMQTERIVLTTKLNYLGCGSYLAISGGFHSLFLILCSGNHSWWDSGFHMFFSYMQSKCLESLYLHRTTKPILEATGYVVNINN